MFALILAGGTGTRLWPRSRTSLPKQLLALTDDDCTMMQATMNRILPIVDTENIFVVTNRQYGSLIHEQLPLLPRKNIIEEPDSKNTAPCIGLAAAYMNLLDPQAVMASLHSDHYIADEEGFRQALLAAEEVARQGYLVTLGIAPTKPETGYGYIQRGQEFGQYNGHSVYQVAEFLEKPDLATAQNFMDSGQHYWNSGIFIWQLSTLFESFNSHMPEFYNQLAQMEQALRAGEAVDTIWQQIKPQSIDVGIMEKAPKVAVVPVDIGWNDVGGWAAIYEINKINKADENNNVVMGAEHIGIDTKGSLIQGNGRFIATIGLEDVVIVDSDDALLICAKDKAQEIKKLVQWLQKNNKTDLL